MRYQFVQEEIRHHDMKLLCHSMEVSRSGYYAWLNRPPSQRVQRHQRLVPKIRTCFKENRQTYGYRRITDALHEQQEVCGKHQVATLMRQLNLKPARKRRFKITTDSRHSKPIYLNVLNRQFTPPQPNHSWASDITYIETQQGWVYVAVVLDLFSRHVVGWAMSERMPNDLVINALRMALQRRNVRHGLLLHSDRGSQYASSAYQALLKQHEIVCSMSRKGNCWDNAPTESFFKTLKTECVYREEFPTREQAMAKIFDYIEVFYNRQRKHSALHYLSPKDYELAYANL